MHLKKGDQVKMMRGKDRGKTGAVLRIDAKTSRVVVENANLVMKRMRPKTSGKKGEMVSVPRAVDVSNAMLICKNCSRPVRVGFRTEGNIKVRYCKKCNAVT